MKLILTLSLTQLTPIGDGDQSPCLVTLHAGKHKCCTHPHGQAQALHPPMQTSTGTAPTHTDKHNHCTHPCRQAQAPHPPTCTYTLHTA